MIRPDEQLRIDRILKDVTREKPQRVYPDDVVFLLLIIDRLLKARAAPKAKA